MGDRFRWGQWIRVVAAGLLAGAAASAWPQVPGAASPSASTPALTLRIVGGLAGLHQYTRNEEPFWTRELSRLTQGKYSAEIVPFDRAGVPEQIGLWLRHVLQTPELFLLGVNAALFVIGMFIETSASIIVLAPILVPVAIHFGVDPVHFGMIMVVNLALGMITPPFGVNLFAACTVAKISLDQIVTRLLPFVAVVLGCLMVITYFPPLSLFLRDLVYR